MMGLFAWDHSWWGEAPERSTRLSKAIGNAQPTSYRYALNRADLSDVAYFLGLASR